MLVAVLSDIHGNLAALDAVLANASACGARSFVNLGDSLSGPLQPAATAERLMALGAATIRGNHERQLLEPATGGMNASDAFAAAQLTDAHRCWLAAQPDTLWLEHDLFACHGTPRSDLEPLLETVEPAGARAATDAEAAERLAGISAAAVLCGHTHVARVRRLADGTLLLNPGSVGLPAYEDDRPHPHRMESGSPHARYALLARAGGAWQAELRTVVYDWTAAAALAAACGRADWARALATGYA